MKKPENHRDKIEELIQNLNKVVEISIQRFLPEIERAEHDFKKGYRGEAFLLLTHVLEMQMYHLWEYFILHSTRKPTPLAELFELKTYTEILWHIGYISASERSDLKAFQTGRNNVVHFVGNHLKKGHPSDKSIIDQFKKGLKISNGLIKIMSKKSEEITQILIKKLDVPADAIIWDGKTWKIKKTKN